MKHVECSTLIISLFLAVLGLHCWEGFSLGAVSVACSLGTVSVVCSLGAVSMACCLGAVSVACCLGVVSMVCFLGVVSVAYCLGAVSECGLLSGCRIWASLIWAMGSGRTCGAQA